MKMEEIKDFCIDSYQLAEKRCILERIKYFLMTGKILQLKDCQISKHNLESHILLRLYKITGSYKMTHNKKFF